MMLGHHWATRLFLKILLLVSALTCLTGFTSARSLDPLAINGNGVLATPPECIVDGKHVIYKAVSTEFLWSIGVAVGTSSYDKYGRPYVGVDSIWFPKFSPEFQYFILLHECGHHKLGHLKSLGPTTAERDTDRYAIARMKWFSDEQFDRFISDLTNRNLLYLASKGAIYRSDVAKGHSWTLEERGVHARFCRTLP